MKDIETRLTNDISKNFNAELEKNVRNALFNIDIDFKNDFDFYEFIRLNVIVLSHAESPFKFEIHLESGGFLLQYSHEQRFDINGLRNGRVSFTFGSVQKIERKTLTP